MECFALILCQNSFGGRSGLITGLTGLLAELPSLDVDRC